MTAAAYPEPGGQGATDGWSGSDASHQAALAETHRGGSKQRRDAVIRALALAKTDGLTWSELAAIYGWHHGQTSRPLSVLHKEGRIARLADTRNRCHIYVLPEYVNGRETGDYTPNAGARAAYADGWQDGYRAAVDQAAS